MDIIAWKKIYETGIVALDKEHQGLVAEINRLYEAIRDKRGAEVLNHILGMLELYTVEHFQHEERLMEEYGYSGLDSQRLEHQSLIQSVAELKARESTPEALAVELFRFLKAWVLEHIVEQDKKYGSFLESRAGRFVD